MVKGLWPHKGPHVTYLELHPWVRASTQVATWEINRKSHLTSEVDWEPRDFLSSSPAYLSPLALQGSPAPTAFTQGWHDQSSHLAGKGRGGRPRPGRLYWANWANWAFLSPKFPWASPHFSGGWGPWFPTLSPPPRSLGL